MPRITRIAGSFAIVTIAYWAYALMAVPWIEPAADPRRNGEITERDRLGGAKLVDSRLDQLQGLFPRGSWELENPKMLESDRATLLFQTYKNYEDGRVDIRPCTIVFAYDGPAESEAQRRRQSVVLEAPAGATLQFDQPLNLNRAKIGRLVKGQLKDVVKIRSGWKEPGPEDDLLIVTRDIQINEQTIFTKNPVDFRWGRHFGRGQDMVIKLLTGPPKPGMESSGPNISGIESFELKRIEQLCIDLGQTMDKKTPSQSVPVEIHCEGPFHFNAVGRVATFKDRVSIRKANPAGPADQIACDLLSLYFLERSKADPNQKPQNASTPNSLDLTPERIEATGKPVVVTAPSRDMEARGEQLEYNLIKNSIALRDSQAVFLRQGPNEIHSRGLYYESVGPGRLGNVEAQGPGRLRGQAPDQPDKQLQAQWKDFLRIYPDKDNKEHKVISLTGDAMLNFPGVGQIEAPGIFFWLFETPPPVEGEQFQMHPNRMLARPGVRMNTPQISSNVEQLEVWFKEKSISSTQQPASAQQGLLASATSTSNPPSSSQPTITSQRFQINGRLLRAQILLDGQQAEVSDLTLEDQIEFREVQTAQPGELPIVIAGDRLEGEQVTSLGGKVSVIGRPARFEGRGLTLSGPNINVDRGANTLSVEGPGQMSAPLPTDLQGQPSAVPTVLTIDWQRRMEFNGRTAAFEHAVVAATTQQLMRTETMLVHMQQPISFSQSNANAKPEVEEIQCRGGVAMEQRTVDPQQQLQSFDRLEVTDLAINLLSGALNAGPGWVNSVRYGMGNMLESQPSASPPSPQLMCMNARFQKSITGNILHRKLTFADEVKMAYAPVKSWDAMLLTTNPDDLGPEGVVAQCDQLSVVQMAMPMSNRQAVEIEMSGNTVVEGTTFTATGNRITYAESKDLLILEGDARNPAKLFRQLQPGAERSDATAKIIHYWPKTKQLKVIDAQSFQIGLPPKNNNRTQ